MNSIKPHLLVHYLLVLTFGVCLAIYYGDDTSFADFSIESDIVKIQTINQADQIENFEYGALTVTQKTEVEKSTNPQI